MLRDWTFSQLYFKPYFTEIRQDIMALHAGLSLEQLVLYKHDSLSSNGACRCRSPAIAANRRCPTQSYMSIGLPSSFLWKKDRG